MRIVTFDAGNPAIVGVRFHYQTREFAGHSLGNLRVALCTGGGRAAEDDCRIRFLVTRRATQHGMRGIELEVRIAIVNKEQIVPSPALLAMTLPAVRSRHVRMRVGMAICAGR